MYDRPPLSLITIGRTMKKRSLMFAFCTLIAFSTISAQDSVGTKTQPESAGARNNPDGDEETLLGIQGIVETLKNLKVGGYIQAQYQVAEAAGASSVAGGSFAGNVRSRFLVRRGRIKFNYKNGLSQSVLQFDVNQNGIGINDAFIALKDPWHQAFGLTAGIFDRPFGFEVMYSSGSREMPERSRLFQTLFPGEREIGAKIEVMPGSGPLSFFNLRAGLFNGVRNTANENDRNKDFIGRAGVELPFADEKLVFDAGISLYSGKVTNTSRYVYSIDPSSTVKMYAVDSASTNVGGTHGRAYYGGDVQMYYDVDGLGELSLRGEYIAGDQPGTSTGTSFYNPYSQKGEVDAITSVYKRAFSGWYAAILQNIGEKNQFIARYDEYDPNTDVEGSDIGVAGTNLTAADMKITTLGLGWIHHWDENVKFVFYYDIVMNENVSPSAAGLLAKYIEDVKDNVFTLRAQFKF
jgi:hypothetical protein